MPARTALAAGHLDKTATSQLTLLSNAAYRAGIARITQRADEAQQRGETLTLRCDLRLYATIGWAR